MTAARVLYIQHASTGSGSAVSLASLIGGLDRTRYEPVLACINPTAGLGAYYEQRDIPVVTAGAVSTTPHTTGGWYRLWNPVHVCRLGRDLLRMRPTMSAVEQLVETHQPDLVHLNSVVLAPAAVAVHRAGIPLVWHVRESVVRGHVGLRRWLVGRLLCTQPDRVIFLSDSDRRQVGRAHHWSVIPNFVDFPTDRPIPHDRRQVRQRLGVPPESKVVLFMGGSSLIKGPLVILEAMPAVRDAIPEAHCLFVGIHPSSYSLGPRLARRLLPLVGRSTPSQRVSQALGSAGDVVTVVPWQSDVGELYEAADVVVVPSVEPHFARPVIEAAAHGVPVVGSRLAGVSDLIEHGVTGLLVEPGEVTSLASALIDVLRDEALARRLGDSAWAVGRHRFNRQRCVEEIMALYDDVLRPSRPARAA